MLNLWIDEKIKYDGSQLKPLNNYLKHGQLGNSIVAWQGPCRVTPEHMIDAEDLKADLKIEGSNMLHFILELFDFNLKAGVLLQRVMADIAKSLIEEMSPVSETFHLHRDGDDLYWNLKKLNISIATASKNSTLIHFALNISNNGTPVPTCSLEDFKISPIEFAHEFMDKVTFEIIDTLKATYKVRTF